MVITIKKDNGETIYNVNEISMKPNKVKLKLLSQKLVL